MSIEKRRLIHKTISPDLVREIRKNADENRIDPMTTTPLPQPGLKERATRIETEFSQYSPSGTISYEMPGVRLRGPNGEYLHEIESEKYPQTQYAVSLILKGIIPVTDFHVEKWPLSSLTPFITKTKYYAFYRDGDMNRVEHEHSFAEIEADVLLLRTIFGDEDHSLETNLEFGYGRYPDRIKNHVINMHVSDNYSKVYFFDFHVSHFNALPKIDIEDFFKSGQSRETIRIYLAKLEMLKERFYGGAGKRHMRAIFEKVLEGKTDRKFKTLFQGFDDFDSFYNSFIQQLTGLFISVDAWARKHPELLKDKTFVEERLLDQKRYIEEQKNQYTGRRNRRDN